MRKFDEGAKGTFYYPDRIVRMWDGSPIKVIAENPQGYVNGDMVRIIYGLEGGTFGENIFEATSPLVDGRAVFYLPILWSQRSLLAHPTHTGTDRRRKIHISVKEKGDTGNSLTSGILIRERTYVTVDNTAESHGRNKRLPAIPIFWYSEKGNGLFGNDKLNYNVNCTPNQVFIIRAIRDANMFNWSMSSGQASAGHIKLSGIKKARVINSPENWTACKIDDITQYVQLLWFEDGSETVLSHWFKIKEETFSRKEIGEVRGKEFLLSTSTARDEWDEVIVNPQENLNERESTKKVYQPNRTLKLTSGLFPPLIIDRLKKIAMSPLIWRYNPFTEIRTEDGIIAQVVQLKGAQSPNATPGEWELTNGDYESEVIEELIYHPLNEFQVEIDCHISTGPGVQGYLFADFRQNKEEEWSQVLQYATTGVQSFIIQIDRTKIVEPQFRLRPQGNPTFTIKNFYIYGNIGAYEDAKIQESSLTITKHSNELSEIELTLELDEFKKPDYLII